ncbi:Phox (PX) domain-containing protein [Raphanus sativus]|nr:Phox (PX) domain-containing protein [Raphanus sativus]
MNYLQSCDADGVLDITPVELGNEDSSCGMIGDLDGNVSVGLLHESSENAKQSFGECTSEPLLASSNSDKPSSTDSHPVINSLQVNNTQPKKENTELNEFYDFVHDMEDILLDSGESSGARYSKSDKMFQLHLSLPNRDGGQTATTSGLEDSSPTVSQRFRIDRVEVVGVKQKKGDVSLSERLVGVKEYTVYVIRGWTLPTPWASVERESRKIFGTSPNAVAERTVLIQDCLNSVLRSRFFPTLPNALLREAAARSSALHLRWMPQILDDGATLVRDFVKALGWGKPRLCEYTGQLFCSSCHTNDMSVLPARVLHHWDFNPYPVSQLAKSYLDSIHEQPMLCVSAVNPFLSSKVPALNHIMSIRKRITIMLPYVHCPFRKTLNKGLSTRRHLLESTDFFALRDLIDLSKGPFAALPAIVETVRKKILEHITEQCLVCCDVGFPVTPDKLVTTHPL